MNIILIDICTIINKGYENWANKEADLIRRYFSIIIARFSANFLITLKIINM